jgi:hypothetical protein
MIDCKVQTQTYYYVIFDVLHFVLLFHSVGLWDTELLNNSFAL